MPERERNSEIRRKSPEIAMKSGQKPGDLDMLRSEFPDAFSGTAYTESLCQEAVKLSQEISALFQKYPNDKAISRLRSFIAIKMGDLEGKLIPVLPMKVNVVSEPVVENRPEGGDSALSISERSRTSHVLKTSLEAPETTESNIQPNLVAVRDLLALATILTELIKDSESMDLDIARFDEHLTSFETDKDSLDTEIKGLENGVSGHYKIKLTVDLARIEERIVQTRENRSKKERRKEELLKVISAIEDCLTLSEDHHYRVGGLAHALILPYLKRALSTHGLTGRIDSMETEFLGVAGKIDIEKRFLSILKSKKELNYTVHDPEKEFILKLEEQIQNRRRKVSYWLQRCSVAGILSGVITAGIYTATKPHASIPRGLRPVSQPIAPSRPWVSQFGERINPDGSKTVTLPAPEVDAQLNFVRRNVLGYLEHEGLLDEKFKRDIAQADDFMLLEGIIMGHFTDTWLVPADNPTFDHLSLTVHPQMKRLIQVMYGREAEVKVYTDNTTRENDRGASLDVSLNKNLLCSDDYKIGLYVKPHAEANGQAHVMHSAVKKRLFCQ